MKRARILLAEDHLAVAEQICSLLDTEFTVVGMVTSGQALVESFRRLRPDVVVSDITMKGMDGITAARSILGTYPDARIVFVTINNDPSLAQKGMSVGALGYVLKLTAGDDLIPAIRAALEGRTFSSFDL